MRVCVRVFACACLRWYQVSGELELDLEELERWRVVEDRMGGDSWEPGTRGPGGMTLPQPSSGPSSAGEPGVEQPAPSSLPS